MNIQRILKQSLIFGPAVVFYTAAAVIITFPISTVFVVMSSVLLFLSVKGLCLMLAGYGGLDSYARAGFAFLCGASGLLTSALLLLAAAGAISIQKFIRKHSRTIMENIPS